MVLAVLPRRPSTALSDEAIASAARIDLDVRLSLSGVAVRRAEYLTRAAGARYRAALAEMSAAAWQHFAAALGTVLRAADRAPAETASTDACHARHRLRAFLAENPDLGRNRSFAHHG
jgi:hypothetical protein